jgi:CDP-2,3-bis-(O-geranylgeranyl)-sn-glycerol synthase
VVNPLLVAPAQVLWVLTSTYAANALATVPRGRGPPMDFGRTWKRDGRRILGASKTWSGFLFGSLAAMPIALLQAYLILIAPPSLAIVPTYGPSVVAAIPVALLLTFGALSGDAVGSFVKRRLGRPSGARTLLLDQLPFAALPVGLGLLVFPGTFVPAFWSLGGLVWFLVFTLGLHALFNYIGYWTGLKKVPW